MVLDPSHSHDAEGPSEGRGPAHAPAGDGLAVTPVEDVGRGGPPAASSRAGAATHALAAERLHRLVLEARVETLEEALEQKDRQLAAVIRQYEAALADRPEDDASADVTATWRDLV